MVEQDISIRAWQRECFAELLHNPIADWMECNIEMQNAPTGMFDNEEAVQGTKIEVGNGEKSKTAMTSRWLIRKACH